MRKFLTPLLFAIIFSGGTFAGLAQCSMCTKTAQQLGEKPAIGLNRGILYLMLAPFAIVGFIGFRWWKSNRHFDEIQKS